MIGAILGGFTILGIFLTVAAWVNGRSIKSYIGELLTEESKLTRELIAKMDERAEKRHNEIVELMTQQHQDVVDLLKKGFGGATT